MNNEFVFLGLLVLVVLIGSALCSGVEAALLTVNPIRVLELATRQAPISRARRLAKLKQRLGRTLTVLVITNNGFNIFGSLMLGGYAAFVFEQRQLNNIALPIFSIGLTILVIIIGEIIPKSIGSSWAIQVSLASAPILHFLSVIMRPLLLLLERLLPVITAENEINTDEEEIRQLARLGSQQGQIEADEAAMIAKVFQLNDLTARDLMTPRVSAPTLDGATHLEDLKSSVLANNSKWWVVLGEEVDKVLGVIKREKLLSALLEGRGKLTPSELSEPVQFVPEMVRVDRLLADFNSEKSDVRVVVDEFGGFVGLIGPESVLAVLAGW
tara:strand:- start:1257 stop:2237 length:981 start_codon:yes stop_codon:yes gene_type:complete